MAKTDFDVIVVGAGPAGSCAALELAKEGVDVALIDKDILPRYKPCAGGVVYRALKDIPVSIDSVIDRRCTTVEFNLLASALHFSISRQQPIISTTLRENLDNLLASEAEKAGAKIFSGCKVFDVHQNPGSIALETEKGGFTAGFVIAADGVFSIVAKQGGWKETRHLIPALECQIYVDDKILEKFSKTARFDFDLVPDGYAWLFPKKDHLSVGIGRMGRQSTRLLDSFNQYIDLLELKPAAKSAQHRSVIPISPRRDDLMKGRILLVGDAAGLADPITAEGISFAVLSGQIAAEALIQGALQQKLVKPRFNRTINKKILNELKMGRIAGNLLYNHPKIRERLFRWYGYKLTKTMTQVFMGEKTYSAVIRNPLNYAKLIRIWNPRDEEVE